MFPNMEDRPRQKSMMKKSTDHSGDMGILVMASVKTMNASPVPSTPCMDKQSVTHTEQSLPRSPGLSHRRPSLPNTGQLSTGYAYTVQVWGSFELSCEIRSLSLQPNYVFKS